MNESLVCKNCNANFKHQQSKHKHMRLYKQKPEHSVKFSCAVCNKQFTHKDSLLKACVCYFFQIFIFSPNDSPSKTMKNVFYFI